MTDVDLISLQHCRQAMVECYRQDDETVLGLLRPLATFSESEQQWIEARGTELINRLRQKYSFGGVAGLLQAFPLSSPQGRAMMSLAEALLRVPDRATAEELIRSHLQGISWEVSAAQRPLLQSAAHLAIRLAVKVLASADAAPHHARWYRWLDCRLKAAVCQSTRLAIRTLGRQFVMGSGIRSAWRNTRSARRRGYRLSFDMLGEAARTQTAADRYLQLYHQAITFLAAHRSSDTAGTPGISVKLSALYPRYCGRQRQRVMAELLPRLRQLALAARDAGIGLTVDAEEAERLDLSLDLIEALLSERELQGWDGFGLAVQAYQKRALWVVRWACALARERGESITVRLVKGAYWDSEIKWAQEQGAEGYPVFTSKAATDASYLACAHELLRMREWVYPQFATHNAATVAAILAMDERDPGRRRQGYEFQRLHGMGQALYDPLLRQQDVACRIYAPVGEQADLLAYLVRRLLENGANSSFVHSLEDDRVPVAALLRNPLAELEEPSAVIPLPADILLGAASESGRRRNSRGGNLNDPAFLQELQQAMPAALPLDEAGGDVAVINPATGEPLGHVRRTSGSEVEQLLVDACEARIAWLARPVAERSDWLRRLADALEQHRAVLMDLCIREAGKNWDDALAEVREAVDFCRYYADQAEGLQAGGGCQPLGVVLCVSPWNFPLAIFLGQVAAALVTGNAVLAKPAEQTPLIARYVCQLAAACGLPRGLLGLIVARGAEAGAWLLPDERIVGVLFTGSVATAARIDQTLAQRQGPAVPLIAETGGQNVMLVDATALPEQVTDDVLRSAFQSAGQRCSALRILLVQEEVADALLEMLRGAMAALVVGDPADPATDVGPVIDAGARQRLQAHLEWVLGQPGVRRVAQCSLPRACDSGYFFAPQLLEIPAISLLQEEVFGPVLHVVRYRTASLPTLMGQVRALGFGLTMGIHSRIHQRCETLAQQAPVGNVYVNRNMVGAVVGVQPFGGRGLSGTGPKAGGPHYLRALVTAAGGAGPKPVSSAGQWPVAVASRCERLQKMLETDERWQSVGSGDWLARQAAMVHWQLLLPGPTGEENRWQAEARGLAMVICSRPADLDYTARQLLLALLAGNTVQWLVSESCHRRAERLLQGLHRAGFRPLLVACYGYLPRPDPELCRLLLGVDGCPWVRSFRQALSRHQRIRVPLICSDDGLALARILSEKTVSVNTAAAGGNLALLSGP
ncbi:bifunctional proline dehydrogenase/L-glutamate gamma-semialdehyde dehydrogenase PutA [Pseudomaricurvus sp. HS19]|uniref:bifunctional proline dehydrogenase/L-glutamate gamma-semialdehyde dehydrogenase PutA n=1 Tax=Pseudomaricurvus sp. HS19 TaxID=2692626 RepID=UPI00136807D1|nr:bifunctional proline dehydrogenase/L-glutamate gamma-semialdehyde dehydrogenase PutA [Pseudomaricurvus sp. HS19]MYM63000.1 bifunctional proline dehydrogenase/L-glutamate gamma-semialdehyde dehydrogenase PutA [Pseudomaricurvus sp. HS19]